MTHAPPFERAAASRRWDAIDVARGVAIVAMVVYHVSWDMSFYDLIATDILAVPAWQWFARSIAGSFLILVGVGLALAHAAGLERRSFLWRLAKIAGAALAITVATFFAFPDSHIFFGILHCIAVSSVLALPFLGAPRALTAAVALVCLLAPSLFQDPGLDHPLLDWLGLGLTEPRTNDYVPIFPWFGLVLIGVLAGQALLRLRTPAVAQWRAGHPLARGLASAGRRSLPIYLLHQPISLAVLYGVLQITGPNPAAEAAPFLQECEANCRAGGSSAESCNATCGCVVGALRQNGLWSQALTDRVAPEEQTRISGLVQQCLRRSPL